jgi:hypothetical protein
MSYKLDRNIGDRLADSLNRRAAPRSDGYWKLPSTRMLGCRGCEELWGRHDGTGVGEGVRLTYARMQRRTWIVDAVAVRWVNRVAERRLSY